MTVSVVEASLFRWHSCTGLAHNHNINIYNLNIIIQLPALQGILINHMWVSKFLPVFSHFVLLIFISSKSDPQMNIRTSYLLYVAIVYY